MTLFALFTLGVAAALLHQHLRFGLNIPGRHGLEWMTLLLFGRMQSRNPWAGLMTGSGAAMAYLVQSSFMLLAHDFKPALIYLLNGVCLDLLFKVTPKGLPVIVKGVVLGGVSFLVKPVLDVPLAVLFEVTAGSLGKHGYYYPILTHFIFGSVGAVMGIYLATFTINYKNKTASRP